MCTGYILQWLDTLVTVTLNPGKSPIAKATTDEVTKILEQAAIEKEKIETTVKSTVFNLDDDVQIRCTIKKYHSSLIALLDQAIANRTSLSDHELLRQLLDKTVATIDELLALIETRFISYLDLEERVPATYLLLVKKELNKKLSSLSKKHKNLPVYQPAFDIMKGDLDLLLNSSEDKQLHSFRQLFYLKELFRELEELQPTEDTSVYSALDHILIAMNFNSKAYIFNLTQRIAMHINRSEQLPERMEQLLFDLKSFKQCHRKPNIIFNIKDADLHEQINNWFSQELFYLEKKIHYLVHPLKAKVTDQAAKGEVKQKIRSVLSVDQMALILRAADETKIIATKSLSNLFKTIAPYLSTPYQENISYDSMRSKSYSAEIKDKAVAVEMLQQIIKRIKEY